MCSLVHCLAGLWSRSPGRSLGDIGLSCVLCRSFHFSPHQISTVLSSLGSTGKKKKERKKEEKKGRKEKQQGEGIFLLCCAAWGDWLVSSFDLSWRYLLWMWCGGVVGGKFAVFLFFFLMMMWQCFCCLVDDVAVFLLSC